MKMFQGFGKVDLPKLKWRSERRDGKCSGHGRCVGRLAAWRVAVKRQSLPFWLLAAGCWPRRNGEDCFQCPAPKPINIDQSREHLSLEFSFSLQNLSLSWLAGIVVPNWLICLFVSFFFSVVVCFLAFSFSFFSGLTARNMSAN